MLRKIFSFRFLALFSFLILFSFQVFSRAGGGGSYSGGGSSGGSGSGGDGGFIIAIFQLIFYDTPFPFNLLIIGLIIFLFFYFANKGNTSIQERSVFNNLSPAPQEKDISLLYDDKESLKAKIRLAFLNIQTAWQKQSLSSVRRFISDGVYQRFNIQFLLMQILEQKNIIYKIDIHRITLVNVREENEYVVVDAAIHATIQDEFKSDKYPTFNQGGSDTFVEYWSFIRKKKVSQNKDLYSSNACPQCGNELPSDVGEIAQCKTCKALVNSGEFDWVLSEITQAMDYQVEGFKKLEKGTNKILASFQKDASFSIQVLEDKASNAFLQILTAQTKGKAEIARRFVSDIYFEKLEKELQTLKEIKDEKVFVRLYLNRVDLVNSYSQNNKDFLIFNLKYTQQQGFLRGSGQLIDVAPYTLNKVLVLCRSSSALIPKGQLYAHSCPNCAAPLPDTLDIRCSYCNAILNSPDYEWIVDNLYNEKEYFKMKLNLEAPLVTQVMPEDSQQAYKIRDYVFNNILILMAADGEFKEEEMAFLKLLIQKLKYNEGKISEWIELAKQNKLSLIWPYELEDKKKVYALMEKAAMADGVLQESEKALLESARKMIE